MWISWEFPATSVRYDAERGTFMAGGKPFLQVDVTEYEYSFKWGNQSWAGWEELVNNWEFTALEQAARSKLSNAKGLLGKVRARRELQPDGAAGESTWACFTCQFIWQTSICTS